MEISWNVASRVAIEPSEVKIGEVFVELEQFTACLSKKCAPTNEVPFIFPTVMSFISVTAQSYPFNMKRVISRSRMTYNFEVI